MMTIDPRSSVAWNCIEFLCNACRNPSVKAKIRKYQFVNPLSRFLLDHLSHEQKLKLLKVLQEITYGMEITGLLPGLGTLLSTLTRWISISNESVVNECLGIIINLCHKNLSGIHALSRSTDLKKFVERCIQLQGLKVEVNVCKLVIILDCNIGNMTRDALYKLIDVTFKYVIEEFNQFDGLFLSHTVEFFLDVLKENHRNEIILGYPDYLKHIQELLGVRISYHNKVKTYILPHFRYLKTIATHQQGVTPQHPIQSVFR